MKVGILGGTFDPIHLGHLLLAEQAKEFASLDEVWFIPTGMPPHKQHHSITCSQHRLKMVERATCDQLHFQVDSIEMERGGLSYTIDTLLYLKEKHPFFQFYLILGTDLMKDFLKWYKIEEIIQIVELISLHRVGFDVKEVPEILKRRIHWIQDGVTTNLSSSLIRSRIQQGYSVRYMLPCKVWQYIKEYSLYGMESHLFSCTKGTSGNSF